MSSSRGCSIVKFKLAFQCQYSTYIQASRSRGAWSFNRQVRAYIQASSSRGRSSNRFMRTCDQAFECQVRAYVRALSAILAERRPSKKNATTAASMFCGRAAINRTVWGAPFPHPTPQGRWVQFPETRLDRADFGQERSSRPGAPRQLRQIHSPQGTEVIPEGLNPKECLGKQRSPRAKLLRLAISISQTIVTTQP